MKELKFKNIYQHDQTILVELNRCATANELAFVKEVLERTQFLLPEPKKQKATIIKFAKR